MVKTSNLNKVELQTCYKDTLSIVLSIFCIVFFLLCHATAWALVVGPIQLLSNLNQPFVADIPLSHLGDLDESQIFVNMASKALFEKSKIPRERLLSDLKFEVFKESNQSGYIQIRSNLPIQEPIVELLINISWPAGKMVRQYTLFLDPSDLSDKPHFLPKTGSVTAPIRNTKVAKPDLETPHNEKATIEATKTNYNNPKRSYGPTKASDTIWHIAHQTVKGTSYTASQLVEKIVALNPHAFVNQEIDQLKEGVTLILPEMHENALEADQHHAQMEFMVEQVDLNRSFESNQKKNP